jgi:hypothetical protein
MKKLMAAMIIAAAPLLVLAQGGPGPGPGPGRGPGTGPGPGPRGNPEQMEKRMRLARTLGLAEALDLDAAEALKLGESIARFDERRLAAHKLMREGRDVLRRAAQGEKLAAAEVDTAIQKVLDARAQIQGVDREIVATVTKDLAPEKKARAVLFLSKFQNRFGGRGMGPGMHGRAGYRGAGPGMNRGRGMGPGGGMGMGPYGMGPPDAGGDGEWDDEE